MILSTEKQVELTMLCKELVSLEKVIESGRLSEEYNLYSYICNKRQYVWDKLKNFSWD